MSVFFDTNVLVYADDLSAGEKSQVARALLRRGMLDKSGFVSTQVLQEFFVAARKKLKLDAGSARTRIEVYSRFHVVTVSPPLVLAAIDLHQLNGVSFWDALIIRAAEHAGCDVLYSEHLQDGRRFGSVRVSNPFA